jgi:hypothetical protein
MIAGFPWNRIALCQLLCNNCHFESRHTRFRSLGLWKLDWKSVPKVDQTGQLDLQGVHLSFVMEI